MSVPLLTRLMRLRRFRVKKTRSFPATWPRICNFSVLTLGGFGHWNYHGGQNGKDNENKAGGTEKEKSKKTVRFNRDGGNKDEEATNKPKKPKGKKRKRAKNDD